MASYQDITVQSPSRIKRWVHRQRFSRAQGLLNVLLDDRVLDYGCGDGFFLHRLADQFPSLKLTGYEPSAQLYEEAKGMLDRLPVRLFNDLQAFSGETFTKISCLETCEHLTDEDLEKALQNIASLLTPEGRALISVPIEIGLSGAAKNLARLARRSTYEFLNLTPTIFFRSLVGFPVARDEVRSLSGLRYIYSHIGFDYRTFERRLARHFTILRRTFNPLPSGPVFNNNVYFLCKKRA